MFQTQLPCCCILPKSVSPDPGPCPRHWFSSWTLPQTLLSTWILPLTMPQTVDCVHSPMALSQAVFPLLLCSPQYSVPDPRPCLPAPDTGSHPGPCPSLCPPSPDPVPDTCFPCCWVLRQTVSPNPVPDSMSPETTLPLSPSWHLSCTELWDSYKQGPDMDSWLLLEGLQEGTRPALRGVVSRLGGGYAPLEL